MRHPHLKILYLNGWRLHRAFLAGGEAVIRDQGSVLSVSTLIQNYYGIEDVYLSLPSVIGLKGVESFMRLQLNQQEEELLRKSAGMLRDTQRQLGL